MKINKKEIAECVGLWLAEVTFTNNCFELIKFFHKVMSYLYKSVEFRPRIYSYSKYNNNLQRIENIKFKDYMDLRANKPYYIYRFASVKLNKNWKELVDVVLQDKSNHTDILRGFFAGEGNIKSGNKCHRIVRIAQKQPVKWIEDILINLNINFSFKERNRSYEIWGRESWDKLAKIKIAELHPEKNEKFQLIYQQFKEYHYSANFLKKFIYKKLIEPKNRQELAEIFSRSPARVSDVLIDLKKENKVKWFRVRSLVYWVRKDQNLIVISSVKQKYLNLLNILKTTKELSEEVSVCCGTVHNRLTELVNLGLIKREEDKTWVKLKTNKKIMVK